MPAQPDRTPTPSQRTVRSVLDEAVFAARQRLLDPVADLTGIDWHAELPPAPVDAVWTGLPAADAPPPPLRVERAAPPADCPGGGENRPLRGARAPRPAPLPPKPVAFPAPAGDPLSAGTVEVCLPPVLESMLPAESRAEAEKVESPGAGGTDLGPVQPGEPLVPPLQHLPDRSSDPGPVAATDLPPEPSVSTSEAADEGQPPVGEPEPPRPPLHLACLGELHTIPGGTATVTPAHLSIAGAASPFLVDITLLETPACGVLLRDGFALAAGDIFTQEDIDHGRIAYRHEGTGRADDRLIFATAEGDVPATALPVVVRAVRRAPELLGPAPLGSLVAGRRVGELLAGVVACPGEAGIAVVGLSGQGVWQASGDQGQTWHDLSDARHGAAVLLAADDQVRFRPQPGWAGTARLTYRAWDQSEGCAGDVVNLAPRHACGGATAFSRQVESAAETIAPLLLTPAAPPAPWRGGLTVGELAGGGLALVRLEGDGVWQCSLNDGASWSDLRSVYHGRARLLGRGDRLRFLPRGDAGRVGLTARAWDESQGCAGDVVNLASHGAAGAGTPFATPTRTFSWRLEADGT